MTYQVDKTAQNSATRPAFKRSLLAAYMMTLSSVPALAQETSEDDLEEVVVTGSRVNLQNAQDIKREADTFVDVISAEDIGSLPDRSVLEAIQRLPGVSIERFAAANDPDHFGVEGSGAVVRGMTQTRSEFNGRDSFTANSGRGLSFQDVPPELMGGVDVYKNQSADMIEGGIAGTISLRTRKPFDSDGRVLSFSADLTYGDMVGGAPTPTISGLWSDRWDTSLGEFGVMLNASDSNLRASSHGIQTDRYEFRQLAPVSTENTDYPGFEYVENPYVYDGSFLDVPDGTEVGDEGVLVPNGSNLTMKEDTRDRSGFAAAVQWESPDDSLLVTGQFMRSDATLAWTENAVKYQTGFNNQRTFGGPGEQYEFDDNGVFLSGSLTDIADGWRGDADRIPHNLSPDAGWGGAPVKEFGHRFQADNRYKRTRTVVDDYAFNVKWTPSEKMELSLDVQHVNASTEDDDVTLMYMTHAVQHYDVKGVGGTPRLDIYSPWHYATEEAIAAHAEDGTDWATDDYFSRPTSYNYNAAMDHYERSHGDSSAIRLDGTYFIEGDFFSKVMLGARYAERDQTIRYSEYNWGGLAPIWQDTAWLDSDMVVEAGLADNYQIVDWGDFYRGGVATIQGGNQVIHPTDELTQDYANWGRYFEGFTSDSCEDWRPSSARALNEQDADGNCIPQDQVGHFLPREINTTAETNSAAYVRLDFDTEIAGHRASGNFGVRVVKIDNTTTGSTVFPDLAPDDVGPEGWNPFDYNPEDYDLFSEESEFLGDPLNYLPEELLAFGNDASSPNYASRSFTQTLPSFNFKFEITDELLARFAISKAIALPDIGDLKNHVSISTVGVNYNFLPQYYNYDADNPHPDAPPGSETGLPVDESGEDIEETRRIDPASIDFNGWSGNSGNPFLKPMESIQTDLSLEWYFAPAGSLTTSLFHKDLENFFINGAFDREFTNPVSGVTQTARINGPYNGDSGKMSGLEIGYQQFYDMLPEPFDGFGIQANYSYIQSKGVPNSNLDPTNTGDGTTAESFAFGDDLPLQGQSDHTANFVAMYEKDGWAARIAYNWRSKYLLTSRDVITGLPMFNDAAGFMDASLFYNINEDIQVGVQGVNLLNTQTKTYMKVDDRIELGRSWFVNDRRYTLLIRGRF